MRHGDDEDNWYAEELQRESTVTNVQTVEDIQSEDIQFDNIEQDVVVSVSEVLGDVELPPSGNLDQRLLSSTSRDVSGNDDHQNACPFLFYLSLSSQVKFG